MGKISKHNILTLQKIFNATGDEKNFFLVEKDIYDSLPTEPYRTETYGIGIYRQGTIKLKTGLIEHIVESPSIVTLGQSVIRSWTKIVESPSSSLIFFMEDFYLKGNIDVFALKRFDFFENNDCHILKINDRFLSKIETIFDQIRIIYNSNHTHKLSLVRGYISILLMEIDEEHKMQSDNQRATIPASTLLIDKFKSQLALHFQRQRSVTFYASKLNLSPKYLSTIIKEQTGKTAGEWIDQMVILEAKVLLQDNELSIGQVADQLNFNDQSTFGKFFKTNTNSSPLEFRKSL